MNLPLYTPQEDPGPDFAALVRRSGLFPELPTRASREFNDVPHGTTCVAIRYDGGVVMAGDRRATAGNFISHRSIEKVFPADRYSGVAIAGAAGPAMEMVHLFQLQLEHYEKVEGAPVSLEGKANQLSQMVRNHLPAAMTGLGVVPIFAGFDTGRGAGRIFQYDVTGGRYEEHDHATTGSGGMQATTVIKLGLRQGLDGSETIDLALRALLEAADEDSATGGPDLVRGIYPVVATIDETGFTRIGDEDLSTRFEAILSELREARA
ncbi:MAG: proteasome subunit beta [Microthrixaceae bacterium]